MAHILMFIMTDLEKQIAVHEGFKATAYLDTTDKLTIGFGRNLYTVGISQEEAVYLLRNDVDRCRKELSSYFWYYDQPYIVQNALVNMCFNLGLKRLLGFHGMIVALESKDYTKAALEALNSKWALQVGDRAKDIALMIRQG